MKQLTICGLVIVFVLAIIVSTAGCTSSTSPSASSTPTVTSTPTPSEQTGVTGSASPTSTPTGTPKTQSGDMSVTVTQVAAPSVSYTSPKAGYKWVAFDCTVKNVQGGKDRYVSPGWFVLTDTEGHVFDYSSVTFSSDIQGFRGIDTDPGEVVKGLVVFEVPQNVKLKALTYDDSRDFEVTFPQ